MSFGLTFDKVIVILVIAVFLIGPDRLPGYAAQLGKLAKTLRDMANTGRDRMREEMGPEFDEVDWTKLDPRRYDPRRIVREALLEDPAPAVATAAAAVAVSGPDDVSGAAFAAGTSTISEPKDHTETGYEQRQRRLGKGKPAPFDAEAT